MWPFKKKKIYKIVWQYDNLASLAYTELIKAYDEADAWAQIRSKHGVAISLAGIEEFVKT